MRPLPTIQAFDAFLKARGLRLDAVVIGGSALALLGVIDRQTRDFDILKPDLAPEVLDAAQAFAKQMRDDGTELGDDWLNNGPSQLVSTLPSGWEARCRPAFAGDALELTTLGRSDLLKTKLFALCDRGTDLADCIALSPTQAELTDAQAWVTTQDANELWPAHVAEVFDDLRGRLGHGV